VIRGRGKQKGNAYENYVGRTLFTKWSGKQWIRTPASGAMKEVTKADLFCKEIMNTQEDVLFVECKKRYTVDLYTIFETGKHEFYDWWEQTRQNARKERKVPVLIFCSNRKKDLIVIEWNLYSRLVWTCQYDWDHIRLNNIVILRFRDFICYNYDDVVKVAKELLRSEDEGV